jgi:hypothetical protein
VELEVERDRWRIGAGRRDVEDWRGGEEERGLNSNAVLRLDGELVPGPATVEPGRSPAGVERVVDGQSHQSSG